jgi:GTP-binding protein Era
MKCGFAAIIGRPSAGKSTLLNALCGEKVAITSPVPQTTRNAIRGIVNRSGGQIVFLDTPGYHESEKKLNLYLKDVVHRALSDADVVLYVVDGTRTPGREEHAVMELLGKSGKPVVAVINKTDLDTPLLAEIRGLVQAHLSPKALLNVSAVKGSNLEGLLQAVLDHCPEGELFYPGDFYTDQNPEFRISEIIREQAIARSQQELPHAIYVEIVDMEFQDAGGQPVSRKMSAPRPETTEELPAGAPPGFFDDDTPRDETAETGDTEKSVPARNLWVRAFLVVERKSQVGILVGHQGAQIKAIRIESLKVMKKIFPWKVRLDLRVKVNPKWRSKDPLLKRMIGTGKQGD